MNGPIDQLRAPFVAVYGQRSEQLLVVTEFDAWAKLRQQQCGHQMALVETCRWCAGTLLVCEAMGGGADHIRVLPMGR